VISVVIPVKDGGSDLVRCLESIASQEVDDDVEVVVVDSGSTDGSVDRARQLGARVHEIPPEEFNHGRTRNLGVELARGDTIVFTSQDATAADDQWLARLVGALRSGGTDVAGVYGRHVAHESALPPERYYWDFLYGPEPRTQRVSGLTEVNFETTHFSNVNSAIPRALLREFPFAEDLIMSEDHEWSRRVLLAGYSVVYEPRAVVMHSHTYSIGGAFRRFFDSGVTADRSFLGESPEARAVMRRASIRYATGELTWLWRTGKRRWIPYSVAYELAKFTGLQLGRRHERLPLGLKRRLSSLPSHWASESVRKRA
jgi:glycosyltransferase involved in cell wall biosynthesis